MRVSTVGTNVAEPPYEKVGTKVVVKLDSGGLVDEIVSVDSVDPGVVETEFDVVVAKLVVSTVPTELVDTL